jgi:uncharacterized membrane protein YgcG
MLIISDFIDISKMIPFSKFEPGRTHCPGCRATLQRLVDECPFCGFTAMQCMTKFPFEPPALSRFMDPQGRMSVVDVKLAGKQMDKLERRFPQVRMYVCITKLEGHVDVREFGYWLFNRSRPESEEARAERIYGLLLVIDRNSRRASLTIGYGLDVFVDDVELERVLENGAAEMQVGDYGRGVVKITKQLKETLTERHTLAEFVVQKWNRLRGGGSSAKSRKDAVVAEPKQTPAEVIVTLREKVPLPPRRRTPIPAKREEDHASTY